MFVHRVLHDRRVPLLRRIPDDLFMPNISWTLAELWQGPGKQVREDASIRDATQAAVPHRSSASTVAYTCVAAFLSSAADSDLQPSPAQAKAQLSAFNSRGDSTRRSSADPTTDVPTRCPACRSSSITTTAKSPDTSSYWRCTSCGEIWNVSRRDGARPGAVPWR